MHNPENTFYQCIFKVGFEPKNVFIEYTLLPIQKPQDQKNLN